MLGSRTHAKPTHPCTKLIGYKRFLCPLTEQRVQDPGSCYRRWIVSVRLPRSFWVGDLKSKVGPTLPGPTAYSWSRQRAREVAKVAVSHSSLGFVCPESHAYINLEAQDGRNKQWPGEEIGTRPVNRLYTRLRLVPTPLH